LQGKLADGEALASATKVGSNAVVATVKALFASEAQVSLLSVLPAGCHPRARAQFHERLATAIAVFPKLPDVFMGWLDRHVKRHPPLRQVYDLNDSTLYWRVTHLVGCGSQFLQRLDVLGANAVLCLAPAPAPAAWLSGMATSIFGS